MPSKLKPLKDKKEHKMTPADSGNASARKDAYKEKPKSKKKK